MINLKKMGAVLLDKFIYRFACDNLLIKKTSGINHKSLAWIDNGFFVTTIPHYNMMINELRTGFMHPVWHTKSNML